MLVLGYGLLTQVLVHVVPAKAFLGISVREKHWRGVRCIRFSTGIMRREFYQHQLVFFVERVVVLSGMLSLILAHIMDALPFMQLKGCFVSCRESVPVSCTHVIGPALLPFSADGFLAITLEGKVPNVVCLREPLKVSARFRDRRQGRTLNDPPVVRVMVVVWRRGRLAKLKE